MGRFEITCELGRGSTGVVHRAHDPETDRDLAVKTFLWPNDIPDERRKEYRKTLSRQATAAEQLSHPGIVTVYEFDEGEDDDLPVVAMEYVPGPTLAELIRTEGALNPSWAITVAQTLAGALQAASAADVLHPNFTPANVLVRESDGVAKITDFATARLVSSADPSEIRGTPTYLAPECIEGQLPDLRSQLYSLAAILHEMLCGEPPHVGETAESIRHAIVHERPVPITERVHDLADTFNAFFDRALAKDPKDRYADVQSFTNALESLRLYQQQFLAEAKPVPSGRPPLRLFDFDAPAETESAPPTAEVVEPIPAVPLPETTDLLDTRTEIITALDVLDPEPEDYTGFRWKVAAIVVTILVLLGAGWALLHRAPTQAPVSLLVPEVLRPAAVPIETTVEPDPTFLDWNRTPFVAQPSELSAWDHLGVAEPSGTAAAGDGVQETAPPPPAKAVKPAAVEAIAEPVLQPEPEAVEETLPAVPAAIEPFPETPVVAAVPVEVSYLDVLVKSSIKDGNLTVLVDGTEVYSAGLAADSKRVKRFFKKTVGKADERLDTRIEIPAGGTTITARVFNAAKDKQYEKTLEVDLQPGEERTLEIAAGRTLGRTLTMKLD